MGKPGSKEAHEVEQKHLKVESSESRLVKAQRAYIPREDDIGYEEGSE